MKNLFILLTLSLTLGTASAEPPQRCGSECCDNCPTDICCQGF